MSNSDVNSVDAVKVELVLQGLDLGLKGRHLASVLHQLKVNILRGYFFDILFSVSIYLREVKITTIQK